MNQPDWINWYNLIGDPFSTRPLQNDKEFEDLLIVTKSMKLHLMPFINYFENQDPTIHLLIGSQGIGKSTILHYILNKVESQYGVIPIYIGILPYKIRNSPDSVFAVSNEVLFASIKNFITYCCEIKPKIAEENKKIFNKWLKFMGLEFLPEIGVVSSKLVTRSFDNLQSVFFEIMKFSETKHIKLVIAIDNLDKIPEKIALEYLKVSTSQPIFEAISSYGVHILVAANKEWVKLFRGQKEYNFLQNRIPLDELSVPETYDLLNRRFKDKFDFDTNTSFSFPFSSDIVKLISEKNKGITRDSLTYSREILKIGYKIKQKSIDIKDLTKKEIPTYSEVFYNISQEKRHDPALTKIRKIGNKIKDNSSLRILGQFLSDIYEGRKTKPLDLLTMRILIDYDILKIGATKNGSTRGLDTEILTLFRAVENSGAAITDFFMNVHSVEEEKYIKIKRPPKTIENSLRDILKNFDISIYNLEEVIISKTPNILKFKKKRLAGKIRRSIETDLRDYLELTQTDKETIDNRNLIESLGRILWFFTGTFIDRFILETKELIDLNPNSWIFRLKGLEHFEKIYNSKINSYWKLKSFNNLRQALKGNTLVSEEDIETFYGYFMDIVRELTKLWLTYFDTKESISIVTELPEIDVKEEIVKESQIYKQELLVNYLYEIIKQFSEKFFYLETYITQNSLPVVVSELNIKTEIWKLIQYLEKIEALKDFVGSFEAKEIEEFDDAYTKGTRALDIYCTSLAKQWQGFKKKKKLLLKALIQKFFSKDKEIEKFTNIYSKYSDKNPVDDFHKKFAALENNTIDKPFYPTVCDAYVQSLAITLLIRNFIHHRALPKQKLLSIDSLYFGLNSIYISILHLYFSHILLNRFFGENTSITAESIDDNKSKLILSSKDEFILTRDLIKQFIEEYKEQQFIFWHFLQEPLVKGCCTLTCMSILLFLKFHEWLDIEIKNLYIKCQWTNVAVFRQEGKFKRIN